MKGFPRRSFKLHAVKSDNAEMLAHLGFSGVATLTLLVPVVVFCFVVGHVWPFYLVAGSELVGAAIGLKNFRASVGRRSVFQTIVIPKTPKTKQPPKLKKAA